MKELDQASNIVDNGLKLDKLNKELIQCKIDIISQFEIVTYPDDLKYQDKEDKLMLDGIEFNGLEGIINDKSFIQIKKFEEKNDQNPLKIKINNLKKTRPQFLDYYRKNKEILLKFSNTKVKINEKIDKDKDMFNKPVKIDKG
jgi:hypothetical protein